MRTSDIGVADMRSTTVDPGSALTSSELNEAMDAAEEMEEAGD